jgi:hypothetical protein
LGWAVWGEGEAVVPTGHERMSEREPEGGALAEGSIEEYRKGNVHGEARVPI